MLSVLRACVCTCGCMIAERVCMCACAYFLLFLLLLLLPAVLAVRPITYHVTVWLMLLFSSTFFNCCPFPPFVFFFFFFFFCFSWIFLQKILPSYPFLTRTAVIFKGGGGNVSKLCRVMTSNNRCDFDLPSATIAVVLIKRPYI